MESLKNGFLIDFMTISVKNILPALLLQFLTESVSNSDVVSKNFVYNERGSLTGYNRSYRFLDEKFLTVNWNEEHPEFGVSINITGQGCAFLFQEDFVKLVNKITNNGYTYNVTRLDLAFDDFEKIIPIKRMLKSFDEFNLTGNQISTKTKKESVVFYNGCFNGIRYHNLKFGSRGSESGLRLYDKRAEQKITEIDYWYRLELELRQKKANAVMDLLVDGVKISDIFTSVLLSTARFVEGNCSQVSQNPTALFFQDFLLLLGNYSLIYTFKE